MFSLLHRCVKNPRLWQLALACYWVALFVGTHMPIERLALSRGTADKFAHVAAFGGLAMLVAITWRLAAGHFHLPQLFSVWAIVVLYGAIEETTQPMVGRTASLIDWSADAIGATLGSMLFWLWPRRWLDNLAPPADRAMEDTRPVPWRGYSLKTLFIAMTIVALACYWLMLPTMNAQRFVRAIHLHDYATAESLFASEDDAFPGSFKDYDHFVANAQLASLTWDDLWKGERRVSIAINYGDDGGIIGCGADIHARRDGLKLGLIVP
jgi:VanZ family protein